MKSTQLNHVALHVADVDRSVAFYRDVLLLEPIPRPSFDFAGAWFRIGVDQELHLIGGRRDEVHSNNRGNHFALRVDDLSEWREHLEGCRANILSRRNRPDGVAQVFVVDPDGHVVELIG
jgi:catechol 2,3-dioxygenase-like lactoylglutathione lyase family enzyme